MATSPFACLVGDILAELKGFSSPEDFLVSDYIDFGKYEEQEDFGFDPPAFQPFFQPQQKQLTSLWTQFLVDQEKESFIQSLPQASFSSSELNESVSQYLSITDGTASSLRETSLSSSGGFENSEGSWSSSSRKWQDDLESATSQEPPSKRVGKLTPEKRKDPPDTMKELPKKSAKRIRKKYGSGQKNLNATPDEKRQEALDKNRIAAAKCRARKSEETKRMQQKSQEQAVQNRMLKRQILSMKEEVTEMTAVLFGHAYCDGCESPKNIQKHLGSLATHSFAVPESASPAEMDCEYGDLAMMHVNEPKATK